MGKTRRRVTFLVLSLEAIGLGLLCAAIYIAGEQRLSCEPGAEGGVACVAETRRVVWLVTVERRAFESIDGVEVAPPAVGRREHWLTLETAEGPVRVLPGSAARTAADVERLEALIDGRTEGKLVFSRSLARWALASAAFGCLWVLVISLIMREFLGYHTPWWWRAITRR